MDVSKIKPLRGWVFLEAATEPEKRSGLYVPIQAHERYPQIGWVISTGQGSALREGQLAVIPNEGTASGYTYWQTFYIEFYELPGERTNFDLEIEPVVREAVEKYRATGEDVWLKMKTIDGDGLQCLTSDVASYGIEDMSQAGTKLSYVPAVLMHFYQDGLERVYYFVRETEILCTIESW